jgi:hypothetical protein
VYDKAADRVSGCPARAATIESFIKVIRTKSGVKGAAATRHHAEAMRIEELKKLMRWSESKCPFQTLERVVEDLQELMLSVKHGLMRGFMTTGFTLWTR